METDPPSRVPLIAQAERSAVEEPISLAYESVESEKPTGRRPRWVYVVVLAYLLVMAGLVAAPAWLYLLTDRDRSILTAGSLFVTALVAAGLCLMLVPVRVTSRRPLTKRSIWFPIVGAAFLFGVLATGAGLALMEGLRFEETTVWYCLGLGAAVWTGWALVFWIVSGKWGPTWIATKLHRLLLAGSVLELLVAVPTHIAVRRRNECCAGIYTGIGICVGVVVMLVALGPGVLFLYRRRWQQVMPRRPATGMPTGQK